MDILKLAEIIIGSIISIGVLVAGTGYGLGKFFEGKNKRTKDEIDLFTSQLDAMEKIVKKQDTEIRALQDKHSNEIKILQEDIKKHTQEIGRLQGVNEEKDKKIAELTGLLQNRDPQTQQFMHLLTEYVMDAKKAMTTTKEHEDKEMELWGGVTKTLADLHALTQRTVQILSK